MAVLVFSTGMAIQLADDIIHVAKKQNKELIFDWLQEQCDKYNSEIESLLRIHRHTPAPVGEIVVNPKPEPPEIESYGLISTLFDSHRQKIDEQIYRLNKRMKKPWSNGSRLNMLSQPILR